MDLKDFPRPADDNGRGLHGSASIGWTGGAEGYDHWVDELMALGVKWVKVLDDAGDSLPFCERLLAADIFPIVRVLRKDPPPNDLPEPNPGHIGNAEEITIRHLIAAGVRYFETNNEPNLGAEWKNNAMPGDMVESARLVALNWLFDARLILEMGGLPGLPAVSIGADMDLMAALVALGRQDILADGCWISLHNYCLNHPLGYPDDPVNRTGQFLTDEQYDLGPYTQWAWWNSDFGRVDTLDQINAERSATKNPTLTILQDHACFREFEYYNHLAVKYLGRSIPIITTEGGVGIGRRQDPRYPRITPAAHSEQTVAIFDFVQRQAPDYYFAATPWLMFETAGWEPDAWYSSFWKRALKEGCDGRNGIPTMSVPEVELGDHLPVIDAVKAMARVARRLPGIQPAPPAQPAVVVQPYTAAPPPPMGAPQPTLPEMPPVAARPMPKVGPSKYTVKPGDTLTTIAKHFGMSWQALAAINQIAAPNLIHPGQVLVIPPPMPAHHTREKSAAPRPPVTPPVPADGAVTPATPPPPIGEPSNMRVETPAPPRPSPRTTPPPPAFDIGGAGQAPSRLTPPPPAFEDRGAGQAAPRATPPPAVEDAGTGHAQPPPPSLNDVRKREAPPPPKITPALIFSSLPVPALDWDPRLDALRISVEAARVPPGQLYWKLIAAVYQGPGESDGKHHIYYVLQNEQGEPVEYQRVWQGWPDDKTDATTNEKGEANIALWASYSPDRGEAGPYLAWVDGLPSDRVKGMGLPLKRQVNFVLTWRRVIS